MHVEVYADVVFFINFIMDFLIFLSVGKLLRRKLRLPRLLLGSFSAAIMYCLLIFIPALQRFLNIFGALAILMVSIMITFNPKCLKDFIKIIVITNIVAVSIGGAAMALFYYTNIQNLIGNALSLSIQNFSFKVLISVTASCYIFIKLISWWVKKITIKHQAFYPIKIYMDNQNLDLNALVDTGNSLRDPISSYPVVIAEFSKLKEFLPDSIKLMYYEKKENDLERVIDEASKTSLLNRIRMIPFNSLGKQNGMLIGFKPDSIEIIDEKENIKLNNVIIGIYNYKLSSDGAYHALLNPEILNQ